MSDAIREAFEAWAVDYTRGWYSIHEFNEDVLQFAWSAYKAALQSQTAPAVPDGWKLVPIEPTKQQIYAAEFPIDDVVSCRQSSQHAIADAAYRAMLAAAPQPDHSPDAGKVVQEKAIKEALESGGWWASCSGCHETNEGVCDGPRSIFGCHAGIGCDECGGIGVIWHEAPTDEQLALLSADPDAPAADGGELQQKLKDPATVHAAMLRGEIARLTVDQIKHLCPELAADGREVEPVRGVFAYAVLDDNGEIVFSVKPDARKKYSPEWKKDVCHAHINDDIRAGLLAKKWTVRPLYTHHAQPRNVVQAEALEAQAKGYRNLCREAEGAGTSVMSESFRRGFIDIMLRAATRATKEAARLRSNGGDES